MRLTRSEALKIRKVLEEAMMTTALSDQRASEAPTLFPMFSALLAAGKTFTQEDVTNRFRLCYNDKLYVVTQPHTMQAGWTPDVAVSLYEEIEYINGIRKIKEYITAEHPFSENELGIDSDGVVWRSLHNNNVYTPVQYAANWEQVEA